MDSFINKLAEGTTVKNTDYTVFDVANTTTGSFSTQKISYASFTKQLSSNITDGIKTLITGLELKINEANTSANNKLDKRGLSLNANEKMSGTLSVLTLCAANVAYFSNTIDMKNNFISNVKDPILDYDAVNKRSLTTAINNIAIPGAGSFLAKSGDTMTGGNLTLSAEPTLDKHATTKFYVDQQILSTKNQIPNISNILSNYIPLSGGTMTSGFITQATDAAPTDNKQLANKKYVDGAISTATSNFITTTTVDTTYIKKAGDTMSGSLGLKGFSEKAGIFSAANTVTLDLSIGNTFSITLSGNINGFTLTNVPTDTFSTTIIITQAAAGGAFTTNFTFAGYTVKWSNGSTPIITTTASKTDIFCFTRVGSIIYAFNGGQNF